MNENQKKFSELLQESYNEEWQKLQDEWRRFDEHCKNFSSSVMKNCNEKIKKMKEEIETEMKNNFYASIDNNTLFLLCLLSYKA